MAHQGRMRFSRYAPLTMCAISAHSAAQCAEIQHGMVPPSSALTARRSSPARPLDSPNRPMRAVTARSPNSHVLALTPCRSSRQQPVAMVPIAWIGWCQDVSTTWHGARTWHSLTSFKRLHRWGGCRGPESRYRYPRHYLFSVPSHISETHPPPLKYAQK